MKKQKAFTLAEIIVVMVIIGIVIAFGVPLIVNDARHKIQNTGFYEAYRALYEGAKIAKLNSPSGKLDVYRADNRFHISVCDLFASIYSVSDVDPTPAGNADADIRREIKSLPTCPSGNIPDSITGLCSDCTLVDDPDRCPDKMPPDPVTHLCSDGQPVRVTTKCPMGLNYQTIAYSDEACSIQAVPGDPNNYCHSLPTYATQYGSGCNDNIVHLNPRNIFTPGGFSNRRVEIDRAITADNNLGYNTNFDDSTVEPNFTTSNNLSFYGLNTYPPAVVDNYNWLVFAETHTGGSYIYRDIYIDTNGKSEHPHASCGGCNISNFAYNDYFVDSTQAPVDLAHDEAVACAEQLECLKKNFGVYKFRLYNNGRVEPITNRTTTATEHTKMRYKLVYVANKNIVDVQKLFKSYDEAREYDLTDPTLVPPPNTNFIYWNKNELLTALGWYSNNGATRPQCCDAVPFPTCTCAPVAGRFNQPCHYDMDTLECAIIPVVPEVNALPIKTKS